MTRLSVYGVSLAVFIVASALTLTSILVPHWVSMDVESQNSDTVYSQHLGLHHYCNTALADKPCRTFPDEEKDCDPNDRYFCSMWRTTGFLMSFATVAELATLVCFVVAIGGGQVKREYGWKVLCGLLSVVSVVQFAAMGLISFLYDNDEYFAVPGWRLDTSWILCTVSAGVAAILVGALSSCAYFLPPEDDGYNFLDDPIDV
ncbi:putative pre-mrna splicing factor [Diaporthe ampelina]|uniref:Putative pre-mrna splicing factor n=1 Tax=Diaporthe ampelina TaxID=1214573 RepID=A0A0G2G0V5_9PEZI|nr:putative pre-mrna splicing factor [Diaporthe ampelina]